MHSVRTPTLSYQRCVPKCRNERLSPDRCTRLYFWSAKVHWRTLRAMVYLPVWSDGMRRLDFAVLYNESSSYLFKKYAWIFHEMSKSRLYSNDSCRLFSGSTCGTSWMRTRRHWLYMKTNLSNRPVRTWATRRPWKNKCKLPCILRYDFDSLSDTCPLFSPAYL